MRDSRPQASSDRCSRATSGTVPIGRVGPLVRSARFRFVKNPPPPTARESTQLAVDSGLSTLDGFHNNDDAADEECTPDEDPQRLVEPDRPRSDNYGQHQQKSQQRKESPQPMFRHCTRHPSRIHPLRFSLTAIRTDGGFRANRGPRIGTLSAAIRGRLTGKRPRDWNCGDGGDPTGDPYTGAFLHRREGRPSPEPARDPREDGNHHCNQLIPSGLDGIGSVWQKCPARTDGVSPNGVAPRFHDKGQPASWKEAVSGSS